jgi:hypothetical protein
MSRKSRIGVSVIFGTLSIALALLWVRSYRAADRLHGRVWGKQSFIVASKYGLLSVIGFRWHGAREFEWRMVSFPADDELSFPWTTSNRWRFLGFGWLNDPLYNVMRSTQTLPDGTTAHFFGAAVATLHGGGPVIPFWFLVCLSAVLSALPWRSTVVGARGFSLRTMVMVMTLIALVLGLGTWLAS